MAKVRESEFAGLALDQAEVLSERSASDLGRRRVPSPGLSIERLRNVIGKGHGGAPHNCILASDEAHEPMRTAAAGRPAGIRRWMKCMAMHDTCLFV
jgi:hypothetical protein